MLEGGCHFRRQRVAHFGGGQILRFSGLAVPPRFVHSLPSGLREAAALAEVGKSHFRAVDGAGAVSRDSQIRRGAIGD